MKKSNLIKVVLVLGISLMVMLFTTNVMAANEVDLTSTIDNTSDTSNSNSNSSNSNSNSSNSNSNRTNNTNTNRTNNTNNTNNSSVYNNTNLPKTGISDTIPVALLLVVFGVSSVYAYKKIRDYKNI